jgi:hypothetical protein
MTDRNKYLERLKGEISKSPQGRYSQNLQNPQGEEPSKPSKPPSNFQKGLGEVPSKPSKLGFEGFEGNQVGGFSEIASPPLDANGVPCGVCPKCNLGEFWQWPKSHPDHDPRDWRCLHCRPIPSGAGPCMTFCGVPDGKERDYPPTDGPVCVHCGRQDEPENTVWTTATYGVPLHTGCEAAWLEKHSPRESQ